MLLLLGTLPLFASTPLPTAPTRYVTDAANVIPDERENALNEKLAQFERDTTNQVIVYVDRRVPAGTTLEEMGAEAIKTWAVGQAKKDNGAILFLFIDDRKSRIEVGYGLEGVLTDARSKWILVGMRDALRAGDYATAVEAGANRILETIQPPAAPPPPPPQRVVGRHIARPSANNDLIFILGGFLAVLFILAVFIALVASLLRREDDWKSGDGTIPRPIHPPPSNWPTSTPTDFSSSSSSSSPSSFSSGSSSSSSSSSSSFSGGGGSGGGGGASDSW